MAEGGVSAYWGKRSGGYYEPKRPKGSSTPWGLVINIKRGGPGHSNSAPKDKSEQKFLRMQKRK